MKKNWPIRLTFLLFAYGAVSLLLPQAFAAVGDVYNLRDDFSTTNNPNTTALGGMWSFRNDADELPLEQADNPIGFIQSPGWDLLGGSGVPAIWRDFTGLITPLPFDPTVVGTHGNLLVRWTSAEIGFARVSGYYFEDDHNPPPDRILGYILEKNEVQIDSQAAVTSSTKLEFDETISIMPGDSIDMRILGNFPGATTVFPGFGGLSQRIEIVSAPPGVDGDYNGNGVVDAADYTAWRDTLDSMTNLAADGNGNGVVDDGDYDVWKGNFGMTTGSGAVLNGASVPEPGAMGLLLVGTLVGAWGLHPRNRRA